MGAVRRARLLGLWSLLVYVFLYAPLAVLAAFSFNRERLTATWRGFTLDWYLRLLDDTQVLSALRNSLLVALIATAVATAIGTAAALAFHRHRFGSQAALDGLVMLPMVIPEIVMASSLLLLFAALGVGLGFTTVVLAHVAFSVSYAVVVVRARLAGFDRSLEEAAMDLGAGPTRTFFRVTLPGIAPGVLAAALLVFALSIDDYVVTSFVAGVGSTTLPLQIYSMVRSGISPEINAVSTVLLVATALLLLAAFVLEQGGRARRAAGPALVGLLILGAPFVLAGRPAGDDHVLNVFIWSGYLPPDTVKAFEARHDVRVRVDLYDSLEALLAKMQAGNADYDVVCPSNYAVEILLAQGLLHPLDRSALPHLANVDPVYLDREFDPGNRYSVPYFTGSCGIGYRKSRTGPVDSWAALWDPRFRGRVLMLDDARETLGAALKRLGQSVNTVDEGTLDRARDLLILQKPLVRAYDSANFEDSLLAGDVWLSQGWNGEFARIMDLDPDIAYVVPKEGSTTFIDSLAIPRGAPHPALAHAFLDFAMEAETAAAICRSMKYTTPNRAALALLPPAIRNNPAIFPPGDVASRLELLRDIGPATVLYDRMWTEVKAAR
jgi:spermidine/putrescine transport system substrate-binding protein/spermidine/putrescine transport system permease protein